MKIKFQMSGGFANIPALNRPIDIDTAQIDPHIAQQLESYVRESRFFDLPARVDSTARGAADYRTYTIEVQDGSHSHTLQLTDPITDSNLQLLVGRLRDMSQTSAGV